MSQIQFDQPARQTIQELANRQMNEAQRNQRATIADRDLAVSNIQNRLAQGSSEEFQSTVSRLRQSSEQSPFNQVLRNSINATLENPDVFTDQQLNDFAARTRQSAATAVRDSLNLTRTEAAQRGTAGSGIVQGQQARLNQQAQAQANQQIGEMEMQASQARAENLRLAQQLGIQMDESAARIQSERLQTLAAFVGEEEARRFSGVLATSEILANTIRQNPDYSGFATLAADLEQAEMDYELRAQQIAQFERELDILEQEQAAAALQVVSMNRNQIYGNLVTHRGVPGVRGSGNHAAAREQLADFTRQLAVKAGGGR